MKKIIFPLFFLILAGLSWFLYYQFEYINELEANQKKMQLDLANFEQRFDEYDKNNKYNLHEPNTYIESTNYYTIDSNKAIIELEIRNAAHSNYGFEVIKYNSDGDAIIIIPDYKIDFFSEESDLYTVKITLEFNDNDDYSKLIVRIYDFNNGTFNQLLWDHAGDI